MGIMEYYILINNEKQGPFDLVTLIKKVKNGNLTSETLVSQSPDGPFTAVSQLPEIAQIIEERVNPTEGDRQENINMTLKAAILEGMELWMRRVLDYTLISGIIMAVGFGLQNLIKMFLPFGSVIPSYLASVMVIALFFSFCNYVIEVKRSQHVNFGEFGRNMRRTLPGFIVVGAIIALFILPYGINIAFGVLASLGMLIVLTFLSFMPFLATDSDMGVMKAAKLSIRKVKNLGLENFGVLFALISINLFVAIIPGILMPQLLSFGLFISIPVTISAIAYIYDQVFV
jgi:hypothetical protein